MNNLRKFFNETEFEQLKNCTDLHAKSLSIALRLFNGIIDKSGEPYVGHLLRVGSSLESVTESSAGLLHDTLEDIEGITSEDLLDVGIPSEVVDIILLVTRDKCMPYSCEIDKIIDSENISAINLKIADMTDNSNESRLVKLDKHLQVKLKRKYYPQLRRLKKARKKYDDRY